MSHRLNKIKNIKISQKLIVGFFIINLLFAIAGVIIYDNTSQSFQTETINKLDGNVNLREAQMETIFEFNNERLNLFTSRNLLKSLALDLYNGTLTQSELNQITSICNGALPSSPDFNKISLASINGTIIASTDSSLVGTSVKDQTYFVSGLTNNSIDNLELDSSHNLHLYLTAPMTNSGKTTAVVVIDSSPQPILSIVKDYTGLGTTGEILLAKEQNGNALILTPTRFDSTAALTLTISASKTSDPTVESLLTSQTTFKNGIDYRNNHVLAASSHIVGTSWIILVKINSNEAYAPITALQNTIMITLLATIAISVLITAYFVYTIVKPLSHLNKISKEITKGDYTKRVKISSKDEIGDLASSFNTMTEFITGNLLKAHKELSSVSMQLASTATDMASSTEEVNASSEEISAIAQQMSIGAQKQNNKLESTLQEASQLEETFKQKIVGITSSTNLIESIASQVNMLALNASIEAARAGEYGRGFAVVADNIRNLADDVKKSLTVVQVNSTDMQSSIMKAIESINNSLAEISTISNQTLDGAEEASSSTEEQSASMEEMSARAQELSRIANNMKELTDQILTVAPMA